MIAVERMRAGMLDSAKAFNLRPEAADLSGAVIGPKEPRKTLSHAGST